MQRSIPVPQILRGFVSLCAILLPTVITSADSPSSFKSELFKTGTLVYSDDFDGEYNRERWGDPKNDRQIKDGKQVVTARFRSKEEAMKVLKRDHHLGLEPVIHLNQIPEAFVCHMRFRFETDNLAPGRPVLQIFGIFLCNGLAQFPVKVSSFAAFPLPPAC